MAKSLPLPKTLAECDKQTVKDLIWVIANSFSSDLSLGEVNKPLDEPAATFDGLFHWSTNKDLLTYVLDLTDTSNIRDADRVLEQNLTKAPEFSEPTMSGAPESPVSANRPTTGALEQFEKEAEAKTAKIKQTQTEAKIQVENAIKRKQELVDEARIQEALKDKKVVVTPVEELPKVTLTSEEKKIIWNLAQAVKVDPGTVQKVVEEKIREAIGKSSQDIKDNISQPIITRTAVDLVEKVKTFTGYKSPSEIPDNISILNPLSPLISIGNPNDPKLKNLIPDDNIREELSKSAQALSISLEAKNNIDYSLTKPLFEGSENISGIFYPQAITQFQIAENQEDQEEKDNGAEIDLQGTYKQGKQIWNYWQKIKSGSVTVDEVVTSTSVVPYSSTATTVLSTTGEATTFLSVAIPTTVGAITGFEVGTLANAYLLSGSPTAPLLADSFAQGLFLSPTVGTSISAPVFETIGGLEISTGAVVTMSAPIATTEIIIGKSTLITLNAGRGFLFAATGEVASTGAPVIALGVKIGQSSIGVLASSTGVKVAASGVFAKIGAAIGQLGTPVVAAIGAAVGWVIGKIAEHINWKKVKEWGAGIIGATTAIIAAPFVGIGAALGIGAVATVGSVALGAGLGGVTIGGIGAGVAGFLGAIGGAFVTTIATPLLIIFLGFPIAVALILFIINSGAYIVPPSSLTAAIENQYIGIEKTATPPGPFQNVNQTITYKVTITAKKGALTGVTITDSCKATSKTGSIDCPVATIPTIPDQITPANPFTFSYSTIYDSNTYFDSLIVNTVNITATVDSTTQSASGSTSVVFGQPPSACLAKDNSWPAKYVGIIDSAIAILSSNFAVYMSKVCSSGGTITVTYSQVCPLGWNCYGAWYNDKIYLMPPALDLGENYTLFTLTHETGHYLQDMTTIGQSLYGDYQKTISPPDICSYGNTVGNYTESFAETIGRYASNYSTGCRTGSFKNDYPANWQFANDKIFK